MRNVSIPGTTKKVHDSTAALRKVGQWNGETDLPWDTDVDQEALAVQEYGTTRLEVMDLWNIEHGRDEWVRFNMESQNWALSQFMHETSTGLHEMLRPCGWTQNIASTQVVDEHST